MMTGGADRAGACASSQCQPCVRPSLRGVELPAKRGRGQSLPCNPLKTLQNGIARSRGEGDRRRDLGSPPKPLMVARMDFANEGPILVTGAGGFVGSAVAREPDRGGRPVRLIVREIRARAAISTSPIPRSCSATCAVPPAVRAAMRVSSGGCSTSRPTIASGRRWTRDRAQTISDDPLRDGGRAGCRRRAHRLHQQRRDVEAA